VKVFPYFNSKNVDIKFTAHDAFLEYISKVNNKRIQWYHRCS